MMIDVTIDSILLINFDSCAIQSGAQVA